jgi:acyl-ACP thioesterase
MAVWQERFTVRSYDVDSSGRARPAAITNYGQEAAVNHARALGVARSELGGERSWMLARLAIELDDLPRFGEEVVVETWPADRLKLFALRDYTFARGDGTRLGVAASAWLVVDLAKRRPVRLPDVVRAIPRADRPPTIDGFPRDLPDLSRPEGERTFHVRWSECDANAHANHAAYVKWAVDSLPEEHLRERRLASLEVVYRAEARLDDSVSAAWGASGDSVVHLLRDEKGGELARLRTRWW